MAKLGTHGTNAGAAVLRLSAALFIMMTHVECVAIITMQQTIAVHCSGDLAKVDRAWHYLYRVWLPSRAFETADLPAMEMFVQLPEEIGWETFDLQICIPVVRL